MEVKSKRTKSDDQEILAQLKEYESIYKHKDKNHLAGHFFKIFIGILLLFLIVFYSDAILRMFYVSEGRGASSLISTNDVIYFNDFNVTFDTSVYRNILAIYDSSKGNEIKVCLLGNVDNDVYRVTAFYVPSIYVQTGINVVSEICDENTIISLHSHPIDNCFFSKEDISSYESFRNIRPDGIIGLMCSKQRFNFYRQ